MFTINLEDGREAPWISSMSKYIKIYIVPPRRL